MISVKPSALQVMMNDAISSFPDECCGFFYGREDEYGNREVEDVMVVNNAKEGDKRRRFLILPNDYLQAENYAEEKQLLLLGVYHSHPNHPAVPSEHDRVAAQPFFSYLIIAVIENQVSHMRSWRLNEQQQFEEENIQQTDLIHQ